ncbi:MAG: 16S rRNA (adenine(1518)-N(6)/adenine(1519)-N(6))-dimethyltransferase RsmA [Candidatus Saccharibacteria bacterium]
MYDMTPKKSLGQHWLHDRDVLQAMCDAGEVSKDDTIVEIGPGLGTLTELLVEQAKEVVAVEYDKELFVGLRKSMVRKNLDIVNDDCLTFNYSKMPAGYKVVANIPYYLTSNLLRVLSESPNPPAVIALLIQKEVAERVAAEPGDMSILSVTTQYYYQASLDMIVPAELFTPPPKVDSQIIKLVRRETPMFGDLDVPQYFRLVKAGFAQRRKKLRSSLSAGLHIEKSEVEQLLDQAGIDPNARPQELSLEQWHALYIAYIA